MTFSHHASVHSSYLCFINCLDLLEGDPNNYLTFFKRGTVYLALGKAKFALMDLDRVLQLKPDFTSVSIVNNRETLSELHEQVYCVAVI
jgi:regulator of sirC expression with transglutaminase-like and TPR domain